jgi:hypothetical protein
MAESSKESRKAAARTRRQEILSQAALWTGRAALAVLAVGLVWGSVEIRSRVRSDPRFLLSSWKLSIGDLPAWAPEEMRRDLEAISLGEEDLSIFTPGVLARVKEAITSCPWVRDVRRLRLVVPGMGGPPAREGFSLADPPPGGGTDATGEAAVPPAGSIDLELELRLPIALVRAGGEDYLTDREGIRMGGGIDPVCARAMGLPAIVGGEARKERHPPPPGSVWEDRDVREGLEVARILFDQKVGERFPASRIETIDISNVGERARAGGCEIVLTVAGLRLGWGRSPISSGARTLPLPDLLKNLRTVLSRPERYAGFDLVCLYTNPMVGTPAVSRR